MEKKEKIKRKDNADNDNFQRQYKSKQMTIQACFQQKNTSELAMQEASDALSKTADSDTVLTYQISSVQLVIDKKLEAFNKA